MSDIELVVKKITGDTSTSTVEVDPSTISFVASATPVITQADAIGGSANDLTLRSQANASGPGGNVNIVGGAGNIAGYNGAVTLTSSASSPQGQVEVQPDTVTVTGDANIFLTGTACQLWLNCALLVSCQNNITSNYTVDTSGSYPDIIIMVDSTSNAVTVTLPAPAHGRMLFFKDTGNNAATNNITIARHGSEKIEGSASSYVLNTNFAKLTLASDGIDWFIV